MLTHLSQFVVCYAQRLTFTTVLRTCLIVAKVLRTLGSYAFVNFSVTFTPKMIGKIDKENLSKFNTCKSFSCIIKIKLRILICKKF